MRARNASHGCIDGLAGTPFSIPATSRSRRHVPLIATSLWACVVAQDRSPTVQRSNPPSDPPRAKVGFCSSSTSLLTAVVSFTAAGVIHSVRLVAPSYPRQRSGLQRPNPTANQDKPHLWLQAQGCRSKVTIQGPTLVAQASLSAQGRSCFLQAHARVLQAHARFLQAHARFLQAHARSTT